MRARCSRYSIFLTNAKLLSVKRLNLCKGWTNCCKMLYINYSSNKLKSVIMSLKLYPIVKIPGSFQEFSNFLRTIFLFWLIFPTNEYCWNDFNGWKDKTTLSEQLKIYDWCWYFELYSRNLLIPLLIFWPWASHLTRHLWVIPKIIKKYVFQVSPS